MEGGIGGFGSGVWMRTGDAIGQTERCKEESGMEMILIGWIIGGTVAIVLGLIMATRRMK